MLPSAVSFIFDGRPFSCRCSTLPTYTPEDGHVGLNM
jgi:hypothetical protein